MAKQGLFGEPGKAISMDDLNEGFSAEELNEGTPQEPETPPVETPAEPVVETKPTEPTEAPKVEEQPKPNESPQGQFSFDVLNKELGKNYESFDQVKADLNKPTMESEYEQVKTQLEEWQSKYNDLNQTYEIISEQYEQASNLVSDDARRVDLYMKANPDKDVSIVQKVFSTDDLSSIADIDMIKLGRRFNTKRLKGSDKDLEASIAEELGQDADTPVSEWPVTAQNRLATMAAEFENQFKQIRSSVQLPEKVNIEELKGKRKQAEEQRLASLTDGWSKIADESLSKTNSIKLPIGDAKEGEEQQFFEWELGQPPKAEVDALKGSYISMGMDPEKDKASFQEALNITLFYKDRAKIMQKYGEDLLARQEERHLDETHNPNPLKDSERTDLTDAEREKAERIAFVREPIMPTFRGHPLFKK